MSTTYDQTSVTYRKGRLELCIEPRPTVPLGCAPDEDGVTRWGDYEWYSDGDVILQNSDGSATIWYGKPTVQDAVREFAKGYYYRFYADGSCVVRYHDGVQSITLYYGEPRKVY